MVTSAQSAARARNHYQTQKILVAEAVRRVLAQTRRAVQSQDPRPITGILMAYQLLAAQKALAAITAEVAGVPFDIMGDLPRGREPYVIPAAFMGVTAEGWRLEDYVGATLEQMAADLEAGTAFSELLWQMQQVVASEVADAGRSAAGAEIYVGPLWTNYVRVLNPPSCPRCVILAGRVYPDNEGFERHPNCDCVHWPVEDWERAHDLGLVSSPMEAFEKGYVTGLSKADTQAIEDGADIIAVVNAHRGMVKTKIAGQTLKITTAGTTRRSAWRRDNPRLPYRLRPESIYKIAGDDRAEALRLLKLYGYIH